MKRILFVDDSEEILMMLETIFPSASFAKCPAEALARKDLKEFDVIVTDNQMPGMFGTEFVKELRSLGVTCPIFMHSGDGPRDTLDRFVTYGGTGFFAKPEQTVTLIKKLRSA